MEQADTTEVLSKFALDLAARTVELWRAKAAELYPAHETDESQAGHLTAAIGTAAMLIIVDAISRIEPDDPSNRLLAFDEIIEAATGILISGATIAKIQEYEAARDLTKPVQATEVSG